MSERSNFSDQVRALVESYLDGKEQFDEAVRRLAAVFRTLITEAKPPPLPSHRPIKLRTLSPNEWMNPMVRGPVHILRAMPLAPGRSPADEQKAQALVEEAWRVAEQSSGDAA